jgi:hypothetical protein
MIRLRAQLGKAFDDGQSCERRLLRWMRNDISHMTDRLNVTRSQKMSFGACLPLLAVTSDSDHSRNTELQLISKV